jgi:1,2-diacylglycerol 3-beta-glucosyltransferase
VRPLVRAAGWLLGGWAASATGYLLVLLIAAVTLRRPAPPRRTGDGAELDVVVLVPAHDEEHNVASTVRSLVAQDYPPEKRRVVVIADNCTDATAAEAAAAGAEVWERHDPGHRGKGQALAWALERLLREQPDVDVVGMVDADCTATPNLLAAWDARMRDGASVVQSDDRVSNPELSPAAARRWAGFALMHEVRAAGKSALGLSCGLFGTGMGFRAAIVRDHPWLSFSITEDAEYHLQLLEAGHVVRFAHEAAVLTPMPESEAAAQDQQTRWEAGKIDVARRTLPRLLRDGLARRDVQRVHAAFQQLVPPQSILVVAAATSLGAAAVARDRRLAALAALALNGQAAFVLGGLVVVRAPRPVWAALATSPALIVRKVMQMLRVLVGRGPTEWIRTARAAPGDE